MTESNIENLNLDDISETKSENGKQIMDFNFELKCLKSLKEGGMMVIPFPAMRSAVLDDHKYMVEYFKA